MTPELESQARDALARVLTRDDFPAVLVDPVSTYLVTGTSPRYISEGTYNAIEPRSYVSIYWLLYYIKRNYDADIRFYVREIRQTFKLYDS